MLFSNNKVNNYKRGNVVLNKRVSKSLSLFFVFVLTFTSVFSFVPNTLVKAEVVSQTFVETFDNFPETSNSYKDGSFIGQNEITWNYSGARGLLVEGGVDYSIEGKGLMFRKPADNPSISATIDGGIRDFSIDTKKAMIGSGKREIELLVNDESKGTFILDNNDTNVQKFIVNNLCIEGRFKLEIKFIGAASSAQTVIDNITWTSYDDGGSGGDPKKKVANVTATPSPGEVKEGTEIFLSTTTEGATVYYAVYTDGVTDVEYEEFDETNLIVVDEALTIKTYAAKEGFKDSDIAEFTYTIKAPATVITIAEARDLGLGNDVIIQGIVTGIIGNNAFIQDDTAGVYLYSGGTQRAEFVVGNEIKVEGKTADFNGLYQISPIISVESITENNELPLPIETTIGELNEELEGQVVRIQNLTLTDVPANKDSNYILKASDGTNSIELRIDTYIEPKIPSSNFEIGDEVIVTAPVGQYKENYQLMIRTIDDITDKPNYATDLFISEYIEGSSNNKAIEIYNGTGSAVDLSGYRVELYSNGSTTAGNTLDLTGTLAHNEVYVIAHSSAGAEIKGKANITSAVTNFNGDDALVLKRNDEIIDVFGQVGVDPGDAWGPNKDTLDHTLVRKSSITAGDIDPNDEFDPTVEWHIYPKDTFIYLGSHTMGKGHEELDTTPPTITHTPVTEGNVNEDIKISATVTDDRGVESVKLYHRVKGEENYKLVDMTKKENVYSYAISKTALSVDGIEYYIEASDGTNTATSPEDIDEPYEIIISDADILPPVVNNLTPASGASTGEELRPVISAEYSDASGIDTESIKLYLDNTDITVDANITESKITYIPDDDLSIGNHKTRLEVSDNAPTPQTAIVEWNFYVGEKEYSFYFGQLHSHTNVSDGQGSLEEAYTWARDEGEADFFAVTDHSNWFDNEKDTSNENITDVSQSTSNSWKRMNAVADQFNKDGEFVAIAGFEMTWSGSTGGWGHINTFNTPWFASRSNSKMNLPAYYEHAAKDIDSISQLNHPGKTFGDFADFGYYSEAADNVVHLIEVGNGEGPIRGKGYFPSYEYYTRALDKGWHIAPSNNQDNHKGNWITSNDARTVVVASELSRDSIFDAIRNLNVYSTEDKNLEIMYTVNGSIMGSMLDEPDSLNITIDINDPDENDFIGKVSIISNGGIVVTSKIFNDNKALWELELDPQYSYYYVRIDQADKDIAVTAPVWTSDITPIGISKVEVSQDPQIIGKSIDISATVYNNSSNILKDVKVEFYKGSLDGEKIGEATAGSIGAGSIGVATIEWSSDNAGKYNIYAKTVIAADGVDKVFSGSTSVEFAKSEDVIKVVLDMAHYNAYISGNYAGKDLTLREIFRDKKYMLVENHDELTAEDLEGAQLLIITDPQSTDDSEYNLKKSLFTDAEVAAIKKYTDNGGALIISSKADYKDGTGEYSNGAQLNKILEAVGTNLRVNDDEVVDYTSNGGQEYRLYFDRYVSTKYNLTDNIPEGTTYSFYSGCSVIIRDGGSDEVVDWLVKGHETTGTIDSDNHGDNVPVEQGNVYAIGAELLPTGAKIIVAGTVFFSDFETASGDNMYSNRQITENILDWMIQPEEIELKTIAEVREDKDNDGIPDNMGQRFTIEGRVTAQSEAVTPKNAFFEVIYVQDETGGITVFGVSATSLPLGTKVRVTGIVDQYDGDTELSVENELKDLVVLDHEVILVEPKLMSTSDSMLEENEGWLVKIQGTVTRMTENSLYITDGTGEARVYVNGYIGDGTENQGNLGKWDPSIKVGDTVSAIGLASEDPEGHRLRVRNTSEIVKIEEIEYPVIINMVKTSDINGKLGTEFELDNMVLVNAVITNKASEAINGTLIIKLVDSGDRTYAIGFMNSVELKVGDLKTLSMGFNVNGVSKGKHTAKVYVWDSFTNKAPLSEVGTVEFTVK